MMDLFFAPAKVLYEKTKRVETFDESLFDIVREMLFVMNEHKGVGLAAPQIGLSLNLFVVNPVASIEKEVPLVYINTKITSFENDFYPMTEGCLSIPDKKFVVMRPDTIEIESFDINGNRFEMKADGFYSRVLQHEIDHINGVLIG